MLRLDKATYLPLPFEFVFSERMSNSLWVSGVLLFSEFINVVCILFYNFTEFIILLYIFIVIYFSWYKEYMIYLTWFSDFSNVLPTVTCANAIANLWNICLEVNILSPSP